ncbi:MAG: AhpC/TSA family protein [Cyclobacteriaceae bacterium]|nr:AhpC/TSA family protein [Cyclobacteriaceae bacterium]
MKIRKILPYFLVLATMACGTKKDPQYTLEISIDGLEDQTWLYLGQRKSGNFEKLDSAQVADGISNMQNTFDGIPKLVLLRIGDTNKAVNFFLEATTIQITANANDLDNTEVKGSASHDELMELKMRLTPMEQASKTLYEAYSAASAEGDTSKLKELEASFEALQEEQNKAVKKFIQDYPASYVSPYALGMYLVYDMTAEQLDATLSMMGNEVHNSPDYIRLSERVEVLKKVAEGQPAVDFTLDDPEGREVSLSSFQGKYLLIDFWASWCGPCRKENPHVVQVYEDFREKGFEILGVSLDTRREAWMDAIEKDGLEWYHVSDLKGWQSSAGQLYGVNSIPHTVLLDKDGIIIAKGLRAKELRNMLETLL